MPPSRNDVIRSLSSSSVSANLRAAPETSGFTPEVLFENLRIGEWRDLAPRDPAQFKMRWIATQYIGRCAACFAITGKADTNFLSHVVFYAASSYRRVGAAQEWLIVAS